MVDESELKEDVGEEKGSPDELWMDVCVECHAIEKIGVSKVIQKLKEKYKIKPLT